MKNIVTLIWLSIIGLASAQARDWEPDTLCGGFEYTTITQPDDYTGPVVSTVIRRMSDCRGSDRAVLYVHGFNDYFLQGWMGREFTDSCYSFYAVDLRRYGRSLRPGQRAFDVRDCASYFADIDSALAVIHADGIRRIALMGHSTGGLITSYYMARRQPADIDALVLNSPFLDWNQSKFQERVLIPVVTCLGRRLSGIDIPQGGSRAYSESLLRGHHGEWDYDTVLKMPQSPPVTTGWIRAITLAQRYLHDHPYSIRVPVLLMRSDNSVYGSDWTEAHNHGDGVLDVRDIHRYGIQLGADVTEDVIPGALHDIMLSEPAVRRRAFDDVVRWLDRIMPYHRPDTN